jgi:hypothetical protein
MASDKDKMAVDRRKVLAQLVELRDEAKRQGNRDARLTAEDHIKEARLAKTEDDWLDLQTATHYIDEMLNSRPGAKDTMSVEDRFYFGKGRKERFANWWAEQQRNLPSQASASASAARILASEMIQIANRLSANVKIVTSVKEKDLVGTNQKLYDAVYAIHEDLQKLRKYVA